MPYIKAQKGINIFYRCAGEGEAVLFLHGFALDSSLWQPQVDLLSKDLRTIAIDLPGHGKSGWRNTNTDLAGLAKQVLSLYTSLNISRPHIVAHSFSGLIALKLAAAYPEAVNKLVLVCAAPKFIRSRGFPAKLTMRELEKLEGLVKNNYPEIVPVFIRSLFTQKEKLDGFKFKQKYLPRQEALISFLKDIRSQDMRLELSKIKALTLIICANGDSIAGDYPAKILHKGIGKSRLKKFYACGHLPSLTREKDFSSTLKALLQQH